MKHIFSPDGEAALNWLVRPDTLVALDYDGTLAPIVAVPEKARMATGAARPLQSLSSLCDVAILTGRSVADVKERLDFTPKYLVGNHGMEGLPVNADVIARAHGLCRSWSEQLREVPALESVMPGIVVEDKNLSISIHYRLARDRSLASALIRERIGALTPAPRVIGGHCVVNLLSPDALDKGMALKRLLGLSDRRNALFIGDDDTDESVFRIAEQDWLTVRVGYRADSAAGFFLHHQSEVVPLLLRVLAAFRRGDGRERRADLARGVRS